MRTSLRARSARLGGFATRSLLRRAWMALRSVLATRERRRALREQYHLHTAREAAEMMGHMKGVLMKLGQIVSFAQHGLPEPARDALRGLQQDAPPMDFALVRGVIEEELGRDLGELFRHVEEEPLAAASIGQVHRARLRDGEQVALKVQYPGVDDAIASDLRASHGIAALVSAVNRNIDAPAVVEELRRRMLEELDYRQELRNQQTFFELWKGHPLIHVPRVYPSLSGRHVLCQEYCRGLSFYDFVAVANAEEKRLAVHVLNDFVFDSMHLHCVFNGDPHPGNYLFREDGRISFLDYGCVKYFPRAFLEDLETLNRSLVDGDKTTFERMLEHMGVVLPGRPYDLDHLWEFFRYHSAPFLEDRVFTFTREWVDRAVEVMSPARNTRINLPPDFLFLNRITFGLNAIMLELGASENFHRMTRRYHHPEEKVPPAVTRLGVEVPERFLSSEVRPAHPARPDADVRSSATRGAG
jgi:predicted unusual protein kinase regulating ubiquinone biosynthesis (AarF/ABC1/UbiB family)